MIQVYNNKDECCGCSACKNICPVQAIQMKYDKEGFLYPVIDTNLCIDCGSCKDICSFKLSKKDKKYLPDTYIYQHKDRECSQSGGAFIGLSDYVLQRGGVVYGCVLDEDNIVHIRAESKRERDFMRGSKYVQSDIQNVYYLIKKDLDAGLEVLFVGTPCQAAGIHSAFQYHKNKNKLLVVDFVCHGVPSPKVFKAYIKYIEKKQGGKAVRFNFKDISEVGWGGEHIESYEVNGKKYEARIWRDIFYDNVAMRPSCAKCPYTTVVRNSDITICDAWQLEKRNPEMMDTTGTSLVMVHSEQGMAVFQNCLSNAKVKNVHIDDYMQVNMFLPSRYDKQLRDDFLHMVYKDFDSALENYYNHRKPYGNWEKLKLRVYVRINKLFYRGIRREIAFFRRNRKNKK